ncbi:hypothetical protein IAR55_006451 [Kwoniella newhampshirensis]|uniref:F-box domain-containing protein n=1 Tax=Kwoniella newhampshirensis TaxID=1651941 RepID=A0AAW0YU22_9TREE
MSIDPALLTHQLSPGDKILTTSPDIDMDGGSDSDLSELSELPEDADDEDQQAVQITAIDDVNSLIGEDGTRRTSARLKLAHKSYSVTTGSSSKHPVTDDDSDYVKPQRKKAKNTKRKIKSNTKTTSKQKKSKENQANSDAASDSEDEIRETTKKGRKPLVAKEAIWNDIPDWGDRTDCPLLNLPTEILDMCFGLDTGLGMRDHLALAGVSRFFRHQMTESVFQEIIHHLGNVTRRPGLITNHVLHIFSRQVPTWRKELKSKITYPNKPDHYIPRGPRTEWSEAQYIVYKEEQAIWREKVKRDRKEALIKENQRALEQKPRVAKIEVGGLSRKILARVKGREPGEPPAARNERGLPIESWTEDESVLRLDAPAISKSNDSPEESVSAEQVTNKKSKKRLSSEAWVVPDSESESEDDNFGLVKLDPETGEAVVHDYYPSKFRAQGANYIARQGINKTDAIREFKVTEAELLCLKHVLVPNFMNRKNPQVIFRRAAVEALAYRSHGGVLGHGRYMKLARAKSAKSAKTRQANIEKAKKNGTYVKKKVRCQVPPYLWNRREFHHEFYCDIDCECYPEWRTSASWWW